MTKEQEERFDAIALTPTDYQREGNYEIYDLDKIFANLKVLIDALLREQSERDKKETTSKLKEEILKMKHRPDCGQNPNYPADQCTPTCGRNHALQEVLDLIDKTTPEGE